MACAFGFARPCCLLSSVRGLVLRYMANTRRDRLSFWRISTGREKVKHPFRVIKRQFGYAKVRFRRLAKNAAQMVTLFAQSNLWVALRHLLATPAEMRR